jgi:hypothetical protein
MCEGLTVAIGILTVCILLGVAVLIHSYEIRPGAYIEGKVDSDQHLLLFGYLTVITLLQASGPVRVHELLVQLRQRGYSHDEIYEVMEGLVCGRIVTVGKSNVNGENIIFSSIKMPNSGGVYMESVMCGVEIT